MIFVVMIAAVTHLGTSRLRRANAAIRAQREAQVVATMSSVRAPSEAPVHVG